MLPLRAGRALAPSCTLPPRLLIFRVLALQCFECQSKVFRAEFQLQSIVKDLPPVYEKFYASEEDRTCPNW